MWVLVLIGICSGGGACSMVRVGEYPTVKECQVAGYNVTSPGSGLISRCVPLPRR